MHNHKNKWLHNVLLVGFYLLLAPPVLAAVKVSIHGAFTGVMAWDLFSGRTACGRSMISLS